MSINVTVSGNPVNIKRGKMVTIDSSSSKDEFDKRRLMRLEQVRQQSKEIADDVRNKVRKEKIKQMCKIEEEGKQKLKDWKNKKLMELQSQYKEALKELGSGHKEAHNVEDELGNLEKEKVYNKLLRIQRGKEAASRLHVDKNKENLEKYVPLQYRKMSSNVEKTRANLVSKLKTKPIVKMKNDKPNTNISIIVPDSGSNSEQSSSTDTEKSLPSCNRTSQEYTEESDHPRESYKDNQIIDVPEVPSGKPTSDLEMEEPEKTDNLPLYTRISDRIKKRETQIPEPDYCDIAEIEHARSNVEVRQTIRSRSDLLESDKSIHIDKEFGQCTCRCAQCRNRLNDSNYVKEKIQPTSELSSDSKHDSKAEAVCRLCSTRMNNDKSSVEMVHHHLQEIPSKPAVKIKDVPLENSNFKLDITKRNKVEYYDHSNKFAVTKEIPSNSYVEKISAGNVEVGPNVLSENEMLEKIKKNDKNAQVRGKKALAVERVKRDYEEMLKKLPLLQKQEKILELKRDKPEYHMPEERLKEMEKIRQNKLENAFHNKFPNIKPAIVTLPKINKTPQNEIPERKIDESLQSLDWNKLETTNSESKMFSAQEVEEIVKAFTQQKPADRRAKLKELLKSLKLQKDELIREIQNMDQSQSGSFIDLINDLNSFDNGDHSNKKETETRSRKRSHTENDLSESSSSSNHDKQNIGKRNVCTKQRKSLSTHHKKKSKNAPKVIILQNISTQTTPVVQKSVKGSVDIQEQIQNEMEIKSLKEYYIQPPTNICEKLHIPCECQEIANPEELCRILINLDEQQPTAVVVEPNKVTQKQIQEKSKGVEVKSIGIGTDIRQISPTDISDKFKVSCKERFGEKVPITTSEHEKDTRRHKKKTPTRNSKEKRNKASWREHLSKNSISTSSTSYMSPPNLHQAPKSYRSFYDLRSKPQQKNFYSSIMSSGESSNFDDIRKMNPQLVAYIEKLLGMSRASIENLNVSSTSSITTPAQSLIELESNNPNNPFNELIRQLSKKIGSLGKDLISSTDKSGVHFNTSISAFDESQNESEKQTSFKISSPAPAVKKKSKEAILEQFTDITDSCSRRIASLAAMIQQIRKEKIEMLHNPLPLDTQVKSPICSDKDISTAYLDLPELKDNKYNQKLTISCSSSSTSLSTDEEEILRKLLEVDLSLAKKINNLKPLENVESDANVKGTSEINNHPETDIALRRRLENLMQPIGYASESTSQQKDGAFVSFLSDIPKLPKFEAKMIDEPFNNNHKRPPPSKGLSVVKKFNENISLVPHELSTIIEADSQLSARVGSALPSPAASKSSMNLSPLKNPELILPHTNKERTEPKFAIYPDKSNEAELIKSLMSNKHLAQCSKPEVDSPMMDTPHSKTGLNDISCSKKCGSLENSSKHYSSSSDDVDTIEAMLRSIGMEWAIPTLHKTKEALALSSSSSSQDLSLKVFGNVSHASDNSLKALLAKHLLDKISSSTLISDISPVSIPAEISDLSAIQAHSKERQRTSTPLTASKTSSKSKEGDVFSMDSDISSVKNATN